MASDSLWNKYRLLPTSWDLPHPDTKQPSLSSSALQSRPAVSSAVTQFHHIGFLLHLSVHKPSLPWGDHGPLRPWNTHFYNVIIFLSIGNTFIWLSAQKILKGPLWDVLFFSTSYPAPSLKYIGTQFYQLHLYAFMQIYANKNIESFPSFLTKKTVCQAHCSALCCFHLSILDLSILVYEEPHILFFLILAWYSERQKSWL